MRHMEMRGGFMRPRERGGLLRPLVPLRGRGVMGMERMRLCPPLRPGLMRGGPPPPPPFARGMVIPPHRPRGMGPVMLPRPHIPPPGPMGPLGPRGMLPRPLPLPRPLGPDIIHPNDPSINSQIPINGAIKSGNNQSKNVKEGNISNKIPAAVGQNQSMMNKAANRNVRIPNRVNKGNQNSGQVGGSKKNRNIKNRWQDNYNQPPPQLQPHMQIQIQTQSAMPPPVQNIHPAHHPQPPPQQNVVNVNSPQMQKHLHPIQSQMSGGGHPQQSQSHSMQNQPSLRGGRNGMNPRNRGTPGMGRGGIMNSIPAGGANRGNMVVNRGGPTLPPRGGVPPLSNRGNAMMGGPPPPVPYSSTPATSYAVPPPIITPQIPVKRGGPPMGVPPVMQPKRVRYDSPLPANGYHGQYQQPPPSQQGMYSSYDVPPSAEIYSNVPPPQVNMPPTQNYNAVEYNCPPAPPNNNLYSNTANVPYSNYNNVGTYSSYSAPTSYDNSVEYAPVNTQPMNTPATDPYGYSKSAPPVDSYGYSNMNYTNPQTGYDDYSGGYVDTGVYGAPVQDPTYGQSVETYANYSY